MGGEKDDMAGRGRFLTRVERGSDLDLVAHRAFQAPVQALYEAWTEPGLFARWWVPQSSGLRLLSCHLDVRPGGGYRLEFAHPAAEGSIAFFGTYREVVPLQRLVWTNEESAEGAVTTVTFEAGDDGTSGLTFQERYPTREALDEACASMEGALPEQFVQLDDLLAARAAGGL